MFMSGYDDEAAFDRFCKKIDLRPVVPKIKCPYMVIAGENDQLSPIEHTERLFEMITAPKRLVIYEGANHGVGGAPSAENGEEKNTLLADWLLDRIKGRKAKSERVWIDSAGHAHAKPFGKPKAAVKTKTAKPKMEPPKKRAASRAKRPATVRRG
jgi:fermentation-respiration switch protein FrsA (DUF1100 family)